MGNIFKQFRKYWYLLAIPLVISLPSIVYILILGIYAVRFGVDTRMLALILPMFSAAIACIPIFVVGLLKKRNFKKTLLLYLFFFLLHAIFINTMVVVT